MMMLNTYHFQGSTFEGIEAPLINRYRCTITDAHQIYYCTLLNTLWSVTYNGTLPLSAKRDPCIHYFQFSYWWLTGCEYKISSFLNISAVQKKLNTGMDYFDLHNTSCLRFSPKRRKKKTLRVCKGTLFSSLNRDKIVDFDVKRVTQEGRIAR